MNRIFKINKWYIFLILLLSITVTTFAYEEGQEGDDEEDKLEESQILPDESKKIAREGGGMVISRIVNGYPMLFWTFAICGQSGDYYTVDFGGGTEVEIDSIYYLDLHCTARYNQKLILGSWNKPGLKSGTKWNGKYLWDHRRAFISILKSWRIDGYNRAFRVMTSHADYPYINAGSPLDYEFTHWVIAHPTNEVTP